MDRKLKTELTEPDNKVKAVNTDHDIKLNKIVLIGGSAGSYQLIHQIVSSLNADLPIAIIIVMHMANHPFDSLLRKLQEAGNLSIGYVEHEQPIAPGNIYLAPPNHHCMVQQGKLYLHRGPRVNTFRPSIDITFRSAAVNYAARTIGVILSGLRDDGAIGMQAIKSCGGTTIVQSPDEAEYKDMPEQALEAVEADHILSVNDIIPLLTEKSKETVKSKIKVPDNIRVEYDLDMFGNNKIDKLNQVGEQVSISCPECGGPLWQIENEKKIHYRCHIGHSLTPTFLNNGQDKKIQETLWFAYRLLDEKLRTQIKLSEKTRQNNPRMYKLLYEDKINEIKNHQELLRNTLNSIIKEEAG